MTATKQKQPERTVAQRMPRTQMVWLTFVAAMTVAGGVLAVADGSMRSASGVPMLAAMGAIETGESAPIINFARGESSPGGGAIRFDRDRWTGVVIHHSGSPAGDAESLNRRHVAWGLDGLGYHFVIGNGNGMGDGVIHASERWLTQRPGAHAVGPDAERHNRHSIAICLIGNGEVRPFAGRQMESLTLLVRELQREFSIAADAVFLHREIAPVRGPGEMFGEADFRASLRRGPD